MYTSSSSNSSPNILSPNSTIDALIGSIRYTDPTRVRNDLSATLQQIQSLQLSVQQLTHNSGYTDTLCTLHGTIPIWYRTQQYNIPMQLYIPLNYAQRPPTVYVKPTSDMRIKERHKHVDMNGLVYLPYLNQWNAQHSNVIELITVMSSIFSDDPPVFKQVSQQQSISQQLEPPPYTPPTSNLTSPMSTLVSPKTTVTSINNNSNTVSRIVSPTKDIVDPRAAQKDQLVQQLTIRLRKWLELFHSTATHEIEQLIEYKAQLNQNAATLPQQVDKLKQEFSRLQSLNEKLLIHIHSVEQQIEQLSTQPVLSVDYAVYCTDTLSQQLCDSVAQFNAIDDTIYLLDRLLYDNKIDIATHLRLIRQLARKQYFLNELIAQIQSTQKQYSNDTYNDNDNDSGSNDTSSAYQYHYPQISLR